ADVDAAAMTEVTEAATPVRADVRTMADDDAAMSEVRAMTDVDTAADMDTTADVDAADVTATALEAAAAVEATGLGRIAGGDARADAKGGDGGQRQQGAAYFGEHTSLLGVLEHCLGCFGQLVVPPPRVGSPLIENFGV